MFTEEELVESEFLEQEEKIKAKPAPKKTVRMFVNPEQLKEDVSINMADLTDCFLNQASLFAHYSSMAAKASEQADNLKLVLEVKEAELNAEHRESLLKGGGKVTEQMVTNAVLTDPRYIKVRKMHNEAKGVLEMLKAVPEAFRQRRDMLIQIGTNAREEMKGDLFIRSKEQKEADLRERTRKAAA
ncbi:MAG: hypothetical protein IBX56_20215 [Methylomicrobium sp.]|nr:hypothetical protein [Methylomicrobium sp.]